MSRLIANVPKGQGVLGQIADTVPDSEREELLKGASEEMETELSRLTGASASD